MKLKIVSILAAAAIQLAAVAISVGQQPLLIPDTLGGTTFSLTAQSGSSNFFPGYTTPTFGYNGNFLGPTLMMNKGDSVSISVLNSLTTSTTVHWHGFHVSPENDGGPHQMIMPGMTWNPKFKIRNFAGTYWYHPHGEGQTERQVTRGLAGLIIIRDSAERSYTLPRTYGVDDFPLILQSKAIDILRQFAIATHEDSIMMVNGTIDPYLDVPQQVVRFRVLNGSSDRSYFLGLSDNRNFQMIASDGGLLQQPHTTNRLRLSPGERAELLIDFGGFTVGDSVDLMSFAAELPRGIVGADSVGVFPTYMGEGYDTNPLNGRNFRLVRFHVGPPTANPVTTIPTTFAPLVPLDTIGVNAHRAIHFSSDTLQFGQTAQVDGPFSMNNQPFHMDSINYWIPLNSKEIWTFTNSTLVAHPLHIHDIQFFILDKNGNPPQPQEQGLKDVVLVMPNATVRVITRFETFADPHVPYMYHCHLLHHEDDGMMGQFIVYDPLAGNIPRATVEDGIAVFPNPFSEKLQLQGKSRSLQGAAYQIVDVAGRTVMEGRLDAGMTLETGNLSAGIYQLRVATGGSVLSTKVVKVK